MHGTIRMGVYIFLNVLFIAMVVWAVICVVQEQKRDDSHNRNDHEHK